MEIFKIIEGFENYSVSDFGNVKNNKTGRILQHLFGSDGYAVVGLMANKQRTRTSIHRLVANAFIANIEHKLYIDHVDNDKVNNKANNLRWVTTKENSQNRSMRNDNTSGLKGVSWNKTSSSWRATIQIDGIKVHLGYFKNLEDAKQARMIKANQAFGVFTNACEKII